MANKSKILKRETDKEFEERTCSNMGNGFEWQSANWSIRKICLALDPSYDKLELIDPDYQRKLVWEPSRNKALIETIFQYGGNKIPTITLRQVDNNKYEIVDGKQRLIGSIKPFVDGKIRLNGAYEDKLQSLNFKDIDENYPKVSSAFMNTTIPVQIAQNMSDDEAKLYFIQINESGVNMRLGEKIHAHQGTPLIKVIDEFRKHNLWECTGQISRDNDYAYISRMLVHIRDSIDNPNSLMHYNNTQLMNELQYYLGDNIPNVILDELTEDLDVLYTVICKNKCKISITDVYTLFLYVHRHKKELLVQKFAKFIKEFYDNMPSNRGVFNLFKTQKNNLRSNYPKYYEWYLKNLEILFKEFLNGRDWDELSKVHLKF